MKKYIHPFEILKLIRDGKVTDMRDLENYYNCSRSFIHLSGFIRGLHEMELVNVSEDHTITPTPKLNDVLRSLRISLKQLAPCDEESIVSSPIFGTPSEPPIDVDVFVLMPFATELKPVFDDHIQNAVKQFDLKAVRADDFFTADSIIGDVWNAINASRILIADCTDRNPNVFYELGIAHTLGKPVILISQTVDDIPFDVQHIRAIIYEYTPRGMKEFENRLISTIETALIYSCSLEEFIAENKSKGRTS